MPKNLGGRPRGGSRCVSAADAQVAVAALEALQRLNTKWMCNSEKSNPASVCEPYYVFRVYMNFKLNLQ